MNSQTDPTPRVERIGRCDGARHVEVDQYPDQLPVRQAPVHDVVGRDVTVEVAHIVQLLEACRRRKAHGLARHPLRSREDGTSPTYPGQLLQ